MKLQVKFLLNQLCVTYLFTKWERSLIFSALKKCTFLKSMLLPNFVFDVFIQEKIVFQWCLNRYYYIIFSRCCYKTSIKFGYTEVVSSDLFMLNIFQTLKSLSSGNIKMAMNIMKKHLHLRWCDALAYSAMHPLSHHCWAITLITDCLLPLLSLILTFLPWFPCKCLCVQPSPILRLWTLWRFCWNCLFCYRLWKLVQSIY